MAIYVKDLRNPFATSSELTYEQVSNESTFGKFRRYVCGPQDPISTFIDDWVKAHNNSGSVTIVQTFEYPERYSDIVRLGRISRNETGQGEALLDDNGGFKYSIEYDGFSYPLTCVKKFNGKLYFTLRYDCSSACFRAFGYTEGKGNLWVRLPLFEAKKIEGSSYQLELTNSESLPEEGRNGQVLYSSTYKEDSPVFWFIRNAAGGIEPLKSFLISCPLVLLAETAKLCGDIFTSLPCLVGEYLMSCENTFLQWLGMAIYVPFAVFSILIDVLALLAKVPILLITCWNREKYGDRYTTLWKHEWERVKERSICTYEFLSTGVKPEPKDENHHELNLFGTWDELNILARNLAQQKDKRAQA